MSHVAYLFPGQGSQYVGMGKDIWNNFPTARKVFEEAGGVLNFDIARLCFEGPLEELTKTANCQPAILTATIATLRALEDYQTGNLIPIAAAGLSLGEYSALVAAGALEFGDAVRLVRRRGEIMEEASRNNPGKMAAIIGLSEAQVRELCEQSGAEVANLNCPDQVIISGAVDAIQEATRIANQLNAKKVVFLSVSGPFHSSWMDGASCELESELEKIAVSPASIPVVSNVTADYVRSPDEIKCSLVHQMNHEVRWERSMRFMASDNVEMFLEVGPGNVLKGLLRRIDSGLKIRNIETSKDIMSS